MGQMKKNNRREIRGAFLCEFPAKRNSWKKPTESPEPWSWLGAKTVAVRLYLKQSESVVSARPLPLINAHLHSFHGAFGDFSRFNPGNRLKHHTSSSCDDRGGLFSCHVLCGYDLVYCGFNGAIWAFFSIRDSVSERWILITIVTSDRYVLVQTYPACVETRWTDLRIQQVMNPAQCHCHYHIPHQGTNVSIELSQ